MLKLERHSRWRYAQLLLSVTQYQEILAGGDGRGWDGMGKVGFWVVLLEGILVFAIIFKLLEWFLGRLKEVKKK